MTIPKQAVVIPYTTTYNRNDDKVYWFRYQSRYDKIDWDVKITVDEINGNIILDKECSCPSFLKFKQGKDCKHIKDAIKLIEKSGVNLNYNEL